MSKHDKVKKGVQQVVQQLVDKTGHVTASSLLDAARPEDSPAHAGFEWDDTKAAEEYRLNQSRKWIRVVKITYDHKPTQLVNVPRVITQAEAESDSENEDRAEREGEYKPLPVVVEIPDEFERALAAAISKLHAARRAVDDLRTAADKVPSADRAAMIAQISKGLEILENALSRTH